MLKKDNPLAEHMAHISASKLPTREEERAWSFEFYLNKNAIAKFLVACPYIAEKFNQDAIEIPNKIITGKKILDLSEYSENCVMDPNIDQYLKSVERGPLSPLVEDMNTLVTLPLNKPTKEDIEVARRKKKRNIFHNIGETLQVKVIPHVMQSRKITQQIRKHGGDITKYLLLVQDLQKIFISKIFMNFQYVQETLMPLAESLYNEGVEMKLSQDDYFEKAGIPFGMLEKIVHTCNMAKATMIKARNNMVVGSLRLVVSTAKQQGMSKRSPYSKDPSRPHGVGAARSSPNQIFGSYGSTSVHQKGPLTSLALAGTSGSIASFPHFKPFKAVKIATFIVYWLWQIFLRMLLAALIKAPVHAIETLTKLLRGTKKFEATFGRSPSFEELSVFTKISVAKICKMQSMTTSYFSVDQANLSNHEEGKMDVVVVDYEENPRRRAKEIEMSNILKKVLGCLKPRAVKILCLRFGIALDGSNTNVKPLTLEATGQDEDMTRERARQLLAEAMSEIHANFPGLSEKIRDLLSDNY